MKPAFRPPALSLALLSAALAAGEPLAAQVVPASAPTVVEIAHDGEHAISRSEAKVDGNAALAIRFTKPADDAVAAAEASEAWQTVRQTLVEFETLAEQRITLNKRLAALDPQDSAAATALRNDATALNRKISEQLNALQTRAGFDDATFDAIITGDRIPGSSPDRPWANLAHWLNTELERLRQLRESLAAGHQVEVTVQAFLRPANGQVRALHVENYDTLPIGELQPINRLGLEMTDREKARLKMEIQQAEAAAQLIRQVTTQKEEILESVKAALARIEQQLDRAVRDLRQLPERAVNSLETKNWSEAIQALRQQPGLTTAADQKLAALAQAAANLQADWQAISAARQHLRVLKPLFRAGNSATLESLLLPNDGLFAGIEQLGRDLSKDLADIQKIPEHLSALAAALNDLPADFSLEDLRAVVSAQTTQAVSQVLEDLKPLLAMIEHAKAVFPTALPVAEAIETLKTPEGTEPIWRDDRPDGRVELARAGLAEGDEVVLKVRSRPPAKPGQPPPTEVVQEYYLGTALMGWHRAIDGQLIFARALDGTDDAKKWKANAAATVHWHYRFREDAAQPSTFKRAINGLYPGLGFHVASLDQGDDSVEFGVGLNLTLWQGLLSAGYGYNLNNSEEPYVYLGLGLLDLLEKTRKLSP